MKYVSWRERPAASFRDYEAAQERVLAIFNEDWRMPASLTIHQFVVRVGDYGGYTSRSRGRTDQGRHQGKAVCFMASMSS